MEIESANGDLTIQERSAMEVAKSIMDLQRSMRSALKRRLKVVEEATNI